LTADPDLRVRETDMLIVILVVGLVASASVS
jgi:hypothetical protein